MFINFDEVFDIQKPQSESIIDEKFIDFLNTTAPNGMRYVKESDTLCILQPEREVTISGLEFDITDELRKKLNDDISIERIVEYMYNSQNSIPLKLPKNECLIINDEKIHLHDLAVGPGLQYEKAKKSFVMIPPKFGSPFSLEVGCENYKEILSVKRVANDSIDIRSFESEESAPLIIKYSLNTTTQSLSLSVKLEISNAKTISDIVTAAEIYNAFILGKGYFVRRDFPISQEIGNATMYDRRSIVFWKKVICIEKALNISFIPPKTPIDNSIVVQVEELYQNLIESAPVKTHIDVSSLSGKTEPQKSDFSTEDKTSILFILSDYVSFNLFGKDLNLPALMMVFNSKVYKTRKTKENFFVYLGNASDDKRKYMSRRLFKTDSDIELFINTLSDDQINEFKDARYSEEYLQD